MEVVQETVGDACQIFSHVAIEKPLAHLGGYHTKLYPDCLSKILGK